MKSIWTDVEHRIFQEFKKHEIENISDFAIAVSGGVDSVVLLHIMLKLKPKAQVAILHFHHGDHDSHEIQNFRDSSCQHVQSVVESYQEKGFQVNFHTQKSNTHLISENDFRKARSEFFETEMNKFYLYYKRKPVLVTGHHRDDLFETNLLKMIRGCGPESLTRFKFWNQQILRPLILFDKKEILEIAQHNNLNWVNDPTNQESDYLRNWLRNEWLPALERKKIGSVKNLGLSLEKMTNAIGFFDATIDINYEQNSDFETDRYLKYWISRAAYNALSSEQQIKALARLLSASQNHQFTLGQLKEIQKRLDKNQKDLRFNIVGVNWFINAEQIVIQL